MYFRKKGNWDTFLFPHTAVFCKPVPSLVIRTVISKEKWDVFQDHWKFFVSGAGTTRFRTPSVARFLLRRRKRKENMAGFL